MGMHVGGSTKTVKTDINVTPFCDICLVLLIIFMVVTPMLQKGIHVQLPKALNPVTQPDSKSNLTITIQADGKVWYGPKWIPSDVLREKLQEAYARNPTRDVYIKGDEHLEFKAVKSVLRVVRSVGFKQVGLVAQHVDASGNPVTGNANA